MTRADAFGITLKPGLNLDILRKGQAFFKAYNGADIVRYEYTRDLGFRVKEALGRSEQKVCEICSKSLCVPVSDDVNDRLLVKQMTHLEFVDTAGKRYPTCYKLRICLRKFGLDISDIVNDGEADISLPSFMEFTGVEVIDPMTEEMSVVYHKYVLRYIQKWANSPIHKGNISEFITDLAVVREKWAPFCGGGIDASRLLTQVGIST